MRTDLHCEEYYVSPYWLASMEAANGYGYLSGLYHRPHHYPPARRRRRRAPSLPPAPPPLPAAVQHIVSPMPPPSIDDYYAHDPPVRHHRRRRSSTTSRRSEVSIPTTVYYQEEEEKQQPRRRQRPRSFVDEQQPVSAQPPRTRRLSAPLEYETMIPRKPVPNIDALTDRLSASSVSPQPPPLDIPRPSRPLQLKSPLSTSSSSTLSAGSSGSSSSNSSSSSNGGSLLFELPATAAALHNQRYYSSPISDISTTASKSSRSLVVNNKCNNNNNNNSNNSNKKQPRQTRRASSMPERKNKLNRVHSALPTMYKPGGEKEQIEEDNVQEEQDEENEEKLVNQPTFWNPRLEQNVAPMRRTFSRRLRGFLLPQRIRAEGDAAVATSHAVDRVWSVERANTPLQPRAGKSWSCPDKPNPFQILGHTMPVADNLGLEFTESDFEQIDAYAANVKQRGPMLTTQVLAQKFLARPYRRDLYKIRSIFVWIMQNISIQGSDNNFTKLRKAMMMRRQQQQQQQQQQAASLEETAESVLSSRCCQTPLGLAKLFCEMATAAGIQETTIVYGYMRGLKDSLEAAILPNGSLAENHVWCSVKVEGEYRFVDCWLASPSNRANNDAMVPHWFLCRPTDMIYTHMPSDDHYQYLCPPVSINTFFALPFVTTEYFAYHIRVLNFNPSQCDLKDDQVCHITLQLDREISCYAEVETRSQSSANHTQVVKTRALAQCTTDQNAERICKIKAVLPPDQWLGWLKIYAGRKMASQTTSSLTTVASSSSSSSASSSNHHAIAAAAAQMAHNPQKLVVEAQNYPLAMCFRLTHHQPTTDAAAHRPFDFVQLHALQQTSDEFYIQEPQCYQLYPLHSYNFCVKSEQSHHKLAIKSPNGKLYKLMYYPQNHTYNGSLVISESGTWSLICLLNHAGGWYVVATWICKS